MTALVKHSAPGPYLGFSLQPVRLCYHLLSSPSDSSVSLELLDDVAIHYSNGNVLLEQCKSALSHNALSNWSEDLWKTIANWLSAVESKKIDGSKATFRLYVTPPKAGKVSSAIHDATSAEAVDLLFGQIKDKLRISRQRDRRFRESVTGVSRKRDRDFTLNVTDGVDAAWIVEGILAAFLEGDRACPRKDYPCARFETYCDTVTRPTSALRRLPEPSRYPRALLPNTCG